MKKCNRLKITVLLCTILLSFTYCQNKEQEELQMTKSFFEDIFINDISSEILYEKYAYKNTNMDKSMEEKKEIFKEHILYLKTQKEHLIKEHLNFDVDFYNKSSFSDLLHFSEEARPNILVVSVDENVESYILINNGKIESFNYVRKGSEGPAYFINNY